MAQKTNPTIFRLGKIKEWQNFYIEKKGTDASVYGFKSLEIKNFVVKFFKDYGLIVYNLKLFYNDNILHIFVSYSSSKKTLFLTNKIIKDQQIKTVSRNKRYFLTPRHSVKRSKYLRKVCRIMRYEKLIKRHRIVKINNKKIRVKIVRVYNYSYFKFKFRRTRLLQYHLAADLKQKQKTMFTVSNECFLNTLLQSLRKFTNNTQTVRITYEHLNKHLIEQLSKKTVKNIKRIILQLRRYTKSEFFKDGVNILFRAVTENQSAQLLAQFIAVGIAKLKRHAFFLRFIKSTLTLFKKKVPTIIKGIKINIKGRFNGAPRAKLRKIRIGHSVKSLSIESNIDYSETTAFTKNGSFGIKVWISTK